MHSISKIIIILAAAVNTAVIQKSLGELLLYYPFDVQNGEVVKNDGSLEDGTNAGGVTYVESKDATFGKAFLGNRTGANDAYIQTGFTGGELGVGGVDGAAVEY